MESNSRKRMLPSQGDKKTGHIYKLCKKLEQHIDQEFEEETSTATLKLECVSDDEQDALAMGDGFDELNMACSDSEDSHEDFGSNGCESVLQSHHHTQEHRKTITRNGECVPHDATNATILSTLIKVSEQIKNLQDSTGSIRKEVADISVRLGRVEKKVGLSLATMEQMKDVVISSSARLAECDPATRAFNFKAVSNEAELMELDAQLGTDEEFYTNVKKWLTVQIDVEDPDNRLHLAMDLVFERTFLPLCSWKGNGKPGPKIPLGARTNIMKLFGDLGSTKFITVNQLFVQKFFLKKLPHAKNRVNNAGLRKTLCHKRTLKKI